jgi:hypothetical protein
VLCITSNVYKNEKPSKKKYNFELAIMNLNSKKKKGEKRKTPITKRLIKIQYDKSILMATESILTLQ